MATVLSHGSRGCEATAGDRTEQGGEQTALVAKNASKTEESWAQKLKMASLLENWIFLHETFSDLISDSTTSNVTEARGPARRTRGPQIFGWDHLKISIRGSSENGEQVNLSSPACRRLHACPPWRNERSPTRGDYLLIVAWTFSLPPSTACSADHTFR